MDDLVQLIATDYTTNEYGIQIPAETVREVWARYQSAMRDEFSDAGVDGLRRGLTVITPIVNYNGEEIVAVQGVRYNVTRTYLLEPTDEIELHLERKVGTGNGL